MIPRLPLVLFALSALLCAADREAVVVKSGVPPIGPYSPAVFVGDYLYVSGQGAKTPDGQMPVSFDGQVKQTLENVKAVVEAAGLSMKNVVYTQVYLKDMARFEEMNHIYAAYFPDSPPARATLGVANLPGQTTVEINAVAIRNVADKRVVQLPGYRTDEPLSPGILTRDRFFLSALRSKAESPEAETEAALKNMQALLEAAGLNMENVVFVNPYLTSRVPMQAMNHIYARHFQLGNTPARATIEVTSLPRNAHIEFTAVAVRDLSARKSIRPKNMPPSPTASPCVFAADTLYCSAKSGFVPGMNGGVFTPDLELQLRQTMRNLLDNLEEAGLKLEDVVSTNVYLDDLADFPAMNKLYAKYFSGIFPARTTIEQLAPTNRKKNSDDSYPEIEQISIIAVKAAQK